MSLPFSRPPGMKVYGLTGGIASGKTTAGKYFADLGVPVVDADDIARRLRAPGGEAHERILKEFGTTDARELRKIIFSDPSRKKALEGILHPLIQAESERVFQELMAKTSAPYLIYEAALLVESGRHLELDGLIVVDSDSASQLERLKARDGVSDEAARQALVAQGDLSIKRRAATQLIRNSGSLDDLRREVQRIHSLLV